ncbi:unnamed protein product, partial [Amoebophrya sp. A120]
DGPRFTAANELHHAQLHTIHEDEYDVQLQQEQIEQDEWQRKANNSEADRVEAPFTPPQEIAEPPPFFSSSS